MEAASGLRLLTATADRRLRLLTATADRRL
jgi:hypothetical protein